MLLPLTLKPLVISRRRCKAYLGPCHFKRVQDVKIWWERFIKFILAIENGSFSSLVYLFSGWWFSIAMLVYQRVYGPKWININDTINCQRSCWSWRWNEASKVESDFNRPNLSDFNPFLPETRWFCILGCPRGSQQILIAVQPLDGPRLPSISPFGIHDWIVYVMPNQK